MVCVAGAQVRSVADIPVIQWFAAATAALSVWALLAATPWAAEPVPKVNLVGRPATEIDNLPEPRSRGPDQHG